MRIADGWAGQREGRVPSQLFLILDPPELVPVVHTAGTLLIRTRGSRGGSDAVIRAPNEQAPA